MKQKKFILNALLLMLLLSMTAAAWSQELTVGGESPMVSFRRLIMGQSAPTASSATLGALFGSDTKDAGRPSFSLRFGNGSSAAVTYASTPADSSGKYLLTTGLNMVTKLNDKSSMSNMFYISSPGKSSGTSLNFSGTQSASSQIPEKSDHMIVNSTDLSVGGINVKLDYQDVGKGFSGFTTLRQQNAASLDKLTQLEKEKGLQRMGFQATGGGLGLAFHNVKGDGGSITNEAFNYSGKSFGIMALTTKVDKGFLRLGSLKADDVTEMGLNILREFNPDAVATNLTDADKQHVLSRTGIERRNILSHLQLGNSTLGFQMLNVGDGSGNVSREGLSLKSKKYSLNFFTQDVSKSFTGLAQLAPVEKQNFGNEYGMHRTNLTAGYTLKPGLQLNMNLSQVKDQVAGLTRYGLALAGSKYSISTDYVNIDPNFTRAADLADSDRATLATEQGMRRFDVNTHFAPTKWLAVDSLFYDAKHSVRDIFKRQFRNSLSINPTKGPQFTLFRDTVSSATDGTPGEFQHQTLAMKDRVAGANISASFDSLRDTNPSVNKSTDGQTLHFDTDPAKRMALLGDFKKIRSSDGKFEDDQTLKLTTRLSETLSFTGLRSMIKTDVQDLELQQMSLTGQIWKNMKFSGRFDQTIDAGRLVGKVREFILAPASPKDYGLFKQFTWGVSTFQIEKPGEASRQFNGGKVGFQVLKNAITLEFQNTVSTNLVAPVKYGFKIASDPDAKKPLHYDFAFKDVEVPGSRDILVRRFNVDWHLGKITRLTYGCLSREDKPDNTFQPISTEFVKLTTKVRKKLDVIGQWQSKVDYGLNERRAGLSVGVSGQLSSRERLEFMYGVDRVASAAGPSSAQNYKLKYDQKVDDTHYISLSGTVTDWTGIHPVNPNLDDVLWQVDVRNLFN